MKKLLFLLPLILALLVSGTVEAKKKKYPMVIIMKANGKRDSLMDLER